MTKSILIDLLCDKCKVPAGRSEQIVNAIFDALEQALNRGERIEIRGFGSFETRSYKGYKGRNPRTGSEVEVKPKRLPFFKAGKELKDRIDAAAQLAASSRAARAAASQAPAREREPTPAVLLDSASPAP